MAMVYKWKAYASVPGLSAQDAGEELERIRRSRNGNMIAADVLKEARKATSPLHGVFEWDDKKAAHHYRLGQASELIRAVVVIDDSKPDSQPVRAFVNVGVDEDRGYTSVVAAMGDSVMRAQVIARAWKELEDWRKRYEGLVEFSQVFEVVDETKDSVARKAA
jgi:hypothetical protein